MLRKVFLYIFIDGAKLRIIFKTAKNNYIYFEALEKKCIFFGRFKLL